MKENSVVERTTQRESVATNYSAWSDTLKITATVIRPVSVNLLADANIVSVTNLFGSKYAFKTFCVPG